MWSRFSLYFDLRLSSHSLIHIDRSRLKEQTRALVGLSQSSIGQLRSNTIHMFYPRDARGVVNAIKRQNPQHHRCSLIQWPSARRPSKTQLWHRMSDCSRKCFRGAVKVCTGGSRALSMRMTCAVAGQIQQLSRVLGAQWAGIQVQVIAGWIWDRRLGQMRISLTLWSEDQEVFMAQGQWLVVTGHYSFEIFSSLSVKMLDKDLFSCSAQSFISFNI